MTVLRLFAVFLCGLCGLGLATSCWGKETGLGTPIESIEVVTGVALPITNVQIAAMAPEHFKPFDPQSTYPLHEDSAMWLRVHLQWPQSIPAKAWTLEIPETLVDAVQLHLRDAQGQWTQRAAGTRVAHQEWPVRSLYPQFYMPATHAGPQTVLIKVLQRVPITLTVAVRPAEHVAADTTRSFLILGALLGVLFLMWVLSLVLAVLYRQSVYAWYALYVGIAFFAAASYSGFGSYALWPATVWWPINLTLVLMLASITAQLQFTRAIFLSKKQSGLLGKSVSVALIVSIAVIATFLVGSWPGAYMRNAMLAVSMLPCLVLLIVLGVRELRKRSLVGALWTIAYLPLLALLTLAFMENFGVLPMPWLPSYAPIYGLVFEAPVLLIALHLHAKTHHGQQVKAQTLADTDPLTGFATAAYLQSALSLQWAQSQRTQQDTTLVYVQPDKDTRLDSDDSLHRVLRLLRTVTRRRDVIARIDSQLLVIMMPDTRLNSALTHRLSRLIALGLMVDASDNHLQPIKFRVAAGTFLTGADSLEQLSAALQGKIDETDGWTKRSIRYVGRTPNSQVGAKELSEFWQKALHQSHPNVTVQRLY